jgi:inhibitor of KinA sporulation pathway (predicted exonuclease)
MELFARFYGEWNPRYKSYKWQKLATAAAHFDLTFEGEAHSALTDARMALMVLRKMAEYAE